MIEITVLPRIGNFHLKACGYCRLNVSWSRIYVIMRMSSLWCDYNIIDMYKIIIFTLQ